MTITRLISDKLETRFILVWTIWTVTTLSDSVEEEDVREADHVDAEEVSSSNRNSPAPTASAAADDDAPDKVQDGSSGGKTPDRALDESNDRGTEAGTP
jgi:hypothetical protein